MQQPIDRFVSCYEGLSRKSYKVNQPNPLYSESTARASYQALKDIVEKQITILLNPEETNYWKNKKAKVIQQAFAHLDAAITLKAQITAEALAGEKIDQWASKEDVRQLYELRLLTIDDMFTFESCTWRWAYTTPLGTVLEEIPLYVIRPSIKTTLNISLTNPFNALVNIFGSYYGTLWGQTDMEIAVEADLAQLKKDLSREQKRLESKNKPSAPPTSATTPALTSTTASSISITSSASSPSTSAGLRSKPLRKKPSGVSLTPILEIPVSTDPTIIKFHDTGSRSGSPERIFRGLTSIPTQPRRALPAISPDTSPALLPSLMPPAQLSPIVGTITTDDLHPPSSNSTTATTSSKLA